MSDQPIRLELTRRFAWPATRVFDAWLDPQVARRFLFATATGEMVRAEIDPRVGGGFVFVDRRDGEDVEHTGKYLEIDRPRRLVFTFGVPKYGPEVSTVEITIIPDGPDACVLTLRHELSAENAPWRERTEAGWAMILVGLDLALF